MGEPTTRKTFKYKLQPTLAQAAQLEAVLRVCRELYNAALQERKEAWQKCHVSVNYHQQKAELPEIRQWPHCAPISSQVLQDVILRLERAFKAFFKRVANGEQVANPRHSRKAERRLVKAQRRVSKRKKGSHRRRKAVQRLQRAHQKIARQRRDFHHKTALSLLTQYDTVYYEDLQVANMVQNGHLAKSIHDAGWSQFCTILVFKAGNAGKQAVAVPPAYTSQICSGCGVIVQKGLSVRWHECPDCGASLHRDQNAALNIQRVGQTRRGAATRMRGAEPRIPSL